MAVTLRYFTEFGKHTFQHITAASSCGGIYAGVYCILYHVYDVVVKEVHVRYLISWWVSCSYCAISGVVAGLYGQWVTQSSSVGLSVPTVGDESSPSKNFRQFVGHGCGKGVGPTENRHCCGAAWCDYAPAMGAWTPKQIHFLPSLLSIVCSAGHRKF